MTRKWQLILLGIFLLQLAVASGFELAHDEAYYWLFSKHLDWGYFDHPPFMAVVIRLFSFLPHGELSVRLGFILLQFASLIFIFRLTRHHDQASLLFFSFPLASVTGLLALPDIPLLFMTAAYFYCLKEYLRADNLKNSALLGLSIALLFYAKYHGVLLVFFTILASPRLLLRRSFYITAAMALLLFFPHLYWQHKTGYLTLKYHFLERPASSFSIKRSAEYVALQIFLSGLLAGPVVWFLAFRKKATDQFERVLKVVSFGTVLFFLLTTFNKKVEANWFIFLAVPLIILVADEEGWKSKLPKNLLWASFIAVIASRLLFVLPASANSLERMKEFHGWKAWAAHVKALCKDEPLVANTYQVASKLSFYLEQEIPAMNYNSRKNQFDLWGWDKQIPTNEVCYITDKKRFPGMEIETPEGKKLKLVKNQSLSALWALK
jgi:4-amino-4-deoxy-L-arabinose transferase-like glycosyltransferase